MKNFLGNEIRWFWGMNKINPPLAVSSQELAMSISNLFFEYEQNAITYWYDYGDIYFDEEEVDYVEKFIFYIINNDITYPDRMAKKIFALSKQIEKQKFNVKKINNMSLKSLLKYYKNERKYFIQMMSALAERGPVPIANYYHQKLLSIVATKAAQQKLIEHCSRYIDILSKALYSSIFLEEKKNALKCSIDFAKCDEDKKSRIIKNHLSKFGWMSFHWSVGKLPTFDEVGNRFLELAPTAKRELEIILNNEKKDEETIKKIVNLLKFNNHEKIILKRYREWLYLRTFVKDNVNISSYKSLPILSAIAQYKNVDVSLMPFLTINEIDNIEKLSKEEIIQKYKNREKGFSAGIINGKFKFGEFKDKDIDRKIHSSDKIIKGQIAYKGKVIGIARILSSPNEQNKVKQGEILVVGMTTPDYVPSMERASAFVTDEGGITCHAAIVARELKKPCIIGTKIATQVLNDGDEVEVDYFLYCFFIFFLII